MAVQLDGYVRDMPVRIDKKTKKQYGVLTLTKESCITDDNGARLDKKLIKMQAEIDAKSSGGGSGSIVENILPFPYIDGSKELNGLTFNINDNGTISINGLSTSLTKFILGKLMLFDGVYTLSGNPEDYSNETYMLKIYVYNGDELVEELNGENGTITFTVSENDWYTYEICIEIKESVEVNNITFRPMLETGVIAHDYVEYEMSRQSFREDIDELFTGRIFVDGKGEEVSEILPVDADTLKGHDVEYFASKESVTDIVDGKTIVGESKKLDGYEAKEWFLHPVEDASEYTRLVDLPNGKWAMYEANKMFTDYPSELIQKGLIYGTVVIDTTDGNTSYKSGIIRATNASVEEMKVVHFFYDSATGYCKFHNDDETLGNETAEEWQEKLDNIQSTSEGSLSQAGWYRVAEYKAVNIAGVHGECANSCNLIIKRMYSNQPSEVHNLRLESVYNSQELKSVASKVSAGHYITKARYSIDTTTFTAYLEIYYAGSNGNATTIEITHPSDVKYCWKAITPTLTSETVEGVTVTCEYDIPANAKPVTTVDDTNLTGWIELTAGFDLNNALGKYRTAQDAIVSTLLNIPIAWTGGEISVEWISFNSDNTYGVQTLAYKYSSTVANYRRAKHNDIWGEWQELSTTTHLANYLSLNDGSTVHKARTEVMGIANTNGENALFGFYSKDGLIGHLGVSGLNQPIFVDPNGNIYNTLLHTGNKPSGTYVGNGDAATERTINIGGICDVIAIHSINGIAIVTSRGAFAFDFATQSARHVSELSCGSGRLNMKNADSLINASGVTYNYYSL